MTSEVLKQWRGPRWLLSLLLAALSMIGPFAVDTYLPAFDGMTQSLSATPVQMQQTLSSYLLAFAVMNLYHGALSDSIGRRRAGLVVGAAARALNSSVAGPGRYTGWRSVPCRVTAPFILLFTRSRWP
jgi:MFS transporter, DHA1 family, multidrug resistance protein